MSEEEILKNLENYIKGWKRNRPNVLATIKKSKRTKRIVELIFSRPDVFKLENEIRNVSEELLTDEILIRFVLARPKEISLLDERVLSTPVLVAFEFAKRRYEYFSSRVWGEWRERIKTPEIYKKCIDDIRSLCDVLPSKYDDQIYRDNELEYYEKLIREILRVCNRDKHLKKRTDNYNIKYESIDFDLEKKLYIFISGYPDSGKTKLSALLEERIKGSVRFDSDMLLEKDMLETPLEVLSGDAKVVIFSDIYAHSFFSSKETEDGYVINVLISPTSIELMYRNSKFMQRIPFSDYERYEIKCIHFDDDIDFIHATNDYTDRINEEADKVIDEILERIGNLGLKSGDNS